MTFLASPLSEHSASAQSSAFAEMDYPKPVNDRVSRKNSPSITPAIGLNDLPDRTKLLKDDWHWMDGYKREPQVALPTYTKALIHPLFAFGTASIRGMKALTPQVTAYWEIKAHGFIFGTSVQFGVGNLSARTYLPSAFADILGEDRNSYAINHHGQAFHGGVSFPFCRSLSNSKNVVVGMLFDGPTRSLSYFINGVYAGTPFTEMDLSQTLYPMVSSTAQQSQYELTNRASLMHPKTLLSSCLTKVASYRIANVNDLPIPKSLKDQLLFRKRYSIYTGRRVIYRSYFPKTRVAFK
ncbi:unnamed protein product [Auanema sp. JU1783]|nr:unnamed protein product [Auanema sp. JU1783]